MAERLRMGEMLLGTLVTLPSPEVCELLSMCGFDWLFIDLEHGPGSVLDAQRMLQAARCPCLVRPQDASDTSLKRVLDIGAAGVIVPNVKNAPEIERIVAACRYPPAGTRPLGTARAHGYGIHSRSYLANANDEVVVVPQIGHIDAVKDIEAIAQVPGVAALLIGVDDLAASLGYPGQPQHGEVGLAIERVRSVCAEAERRVGIYAPTPDQAARWIGAGFTLVAVGSDIAALQQRGHEIVQLLK
jgi:2-dehydro-3-deoxyglucarate aldolase